MTAIVQVDTDNISVSYASVDPCDHLDLDRAVIDLADLRAVRAALSDWEDVLASYIADSLGRNTIDIDGVGHVEVRHGVVRKDWDRRGLVRAVLDSHRRPTDDGEIDPADDGFAEVSGEQLTCSPDLSRVLDCWNLGAPRVTALRDRGIDPDEFAEATPGRVSVVIT